MTFWHYEWALIRARELDLTTRERLVFGLLGARATAGGLVTTSVETMAAEIGLDGRNFRRIVRELSDERREFAAVGMAPAGRKVRLYRLPSEGAARELVEADRAARRAAWDQKQPGHSDRHLGQPGHSDRVEPGHSDRVATPTRSHRPGWPMDPVKATGLAPSSADLQSANPVTVTRQPGHSDPQPGHSDRHNNKQSNNHESAPRQRRYSSSGDRAKDWRSRVTP